jgi:hypothetical protein
VRTKTTGNKQTLNLLLLNGNLYPSDSADYDLLKRRHVLIYRIQLSSLEQLKRTALTYLNIVVEPFSVLWEQFVPHLEQQLAAIGEARTISKHEFWLKVPIEKTKDADNFIHRTNRFLQRYCLRVSLNTIHTEHFVKHQLRIVKGEDINNSYAFKNENDVGATVEVDLTPCLKMVFTRRVFEGSPSIGVQVMDKHGDDWHDRLNRLANVANIPKEQFTELASFFLNLS